MRGIAMILAVVSAVLMTGSEASLSDTWDSVTHAAHTAWDWTKEHCSGSVGFPSGVSVTCSGRKRGVRGEPVDEGLLEALDQACPSFDVGPDAKLSDVVRAAFVEVDEDKDGQLNQIESANFAQLIDVLNYCAELRKWGKIQ